MRKLAIITTHPVQYYAPVFKLLHQGGKIEIKVFYTWGIASISKFDPGFNKTIEWDVPVLEGYPFEWVENGSKDPGTHHFKGIINPGLIKQVESWQPDAVLFYGWGFSSHLKAIRYFKNKIPVLFRGDSTLFDEGRGIKALLRTVFLRWVYSHVDHAFYVGTNNKAYYKKYGLKENQLTFAPHAVDNNRFTTNKSTEAKLIRRELGINNDHLVILFAGKFEEKKDPQILLDAFLGLYSHDTHLLFIGNGPLEAPLKLKAKGHGNVHFMDFQNQSKMPAIYQVCDVFCLPSKGPNETWGLAINEAMASGKAILASDVVGCAVDLIKNEKNGSIFSAGDMDSIVGCMEHLIKIKDQLAEYGEQSRIMIKDWNFTNIVQTIENQLLDETH